MNKYQQYIDSEDWEFVPYENAKGIPSKFNGNRHYEGSGGIPINTNILSSNANDMKVPIEQANLLVEGGGKKGNKGGEYYVPNAEEGGKTQNAFVLSDRKNVGWGGKSPSQQYEDITKAEFGISADKFNKNINKRDKFVADNIKFLGNKEAEQTENAVSKLTQNIQDGMLNLAHDIYMTQEQVKQSKGMKNDLDQAKNGIHIDKSKRGTFKAQATKMGMGVQEAASKILNAPEGKYSSAMRRKANFAKNFAKEVGGEIPDEQVYPGMEMFMEHGGYLPKAQYGIPEVIPDNLKSKKGLLETQPLQLTENIYGNYRNYPTTGSIYEDIKRLGYKGKPEIGEMQQWVIKNHPNKVYEYMQYTPMTNKGKDIWNKKYANKYGKDVDVTKMSKQDILDSFGDNLWDYRFPKLQQPAKTAPQLKQTPTLDTPSKINLDVTGTSKGKTNIPNVIPALRFKEPYLTTPPALFQEDPYLTQYRTPDLEPALVEQRRLYLTLGKNLNPTQKANLAANMAGKTNELYGNYFNQMQQGKQAVDQFNAQTLAGVRGRNIARGDKFYTDWMQTLGNLGTQQLLDTQAANQDWANIQHEGRMANYAEQIYNPEYIDYMQYANPSLQRYPQISNLDEKTYKVDKSGNLVLVGAKDKAKTGGKITKRFKKKK